MEAVFGSPSCLLHRKRVSRNKLGSKPVDRYKGKPHLDRNDLAGVKIGCRLGDRSFPAGETSFRSRVAATRATGLPRVRPNAFSRGAFVPHHFVLVPRNVVGLHEHRAGNCCPSQRAASRDHPRGPGEPGERKGGSEDETFVCPVELNDTCLDSGLPRETREGLSDLGPNRSQTRFQRF